MAHKTDLNIFCQSNKISVPIYATECTSDGFKTVLRFDDGLFTSKSCHKTKKEAENDVALVALQALKGNSKADSGLRTVSYFGAESRESAVLLNPKGEQLTLTKSQVFEQHHDAHPQTTSPTQSYGTRHGLPLDVCSKGKPLGAIRILNPVEMYQQKLSCLSQLRQEVDMKTVRRRQNKMVYQCDVEACGMTFTSGDCSNAVQAEYMATINALQALNITESPLSRSIQDNPGLLHYSPALHTAHLHPSPLTIPAFLSSPNTPPLLESKGSLPANVTMQMGSSDVQPTRATFVKEPTKPKLYPPTAFTQHVTTGTCSPQQAMHKSSPPLAVSHQFRTPQTRVEAKSGSPVSPEVVGNQSISAASQSLGGGASAKQSLHEFCQKSKLPNPEYHHSSPTDAVGYICTVKIGEKTFASPVEKTKKHADISASHLALMILQGKNVKHTKDLVKGSVPLAV